MRFKFLLFVFFVVLISISPNIFAQNHKKINSKTYYKKYDSLSVLKQKLLTDKKLLQSQIDSLTNISDKLDSALKIALPKYFVRKYGHKIGMRVALGKVWKGMTEKMLRDGWGKPDRIHTSTYKWGIYSQWYYGDIIYFFRNGKLIDWEEKRAGKK